ncbi:MAG TPA: D-glycero-beta-D-manno-heptose 1,7-bisphosphate 7-phosphatase [Gammaproteobacteria bacterium]|nr:D-glycero-beta-D-manno-heptose 1,7-bisphosphate 7-phosphatase [Gammaproteobacteria bacterium]
MAKRAARLVLIDRDGVINRDSVEYIKSVAEWQPLPGSLEALADLTRAGFAVAVVTNQSGIGRGFFTERTLAAIHEAMRAAVEAAGGRIAGVFHCPHRPDEGCHCRKPRPGLLHQAAEALGLALAGAPFICDKASDVEAARAAGARPILVGAADPDPVTAGVERYADLAAAARQLIGEAGD